MSRKQAKQFTQVLSNNPNHSGVKRCSHCLFRLKRSEILELWMSIPRPVRQGHDLCQDQMNRAIRTIYMMKEDNDSEILRNGLQIFRYWHITLCKIWRKFLRDKRVPISFKGRERAARIKLVSMEWFEPIREEVDRLRWKEKRAVGLADIQKWLLETHDITISRGRLPYCLYRIRFIFPKTFKLTMKMKKLVFANFVRIT